MADRLVTCANCGARYNLPASFTAAKAKCKKCGSTIDVASSLAAEEEAHAPEAPRARSHAGARGHAAARGHAGSGARKGEFVKMGTEKKKNGMVIAIGVTVLSVMGFVLWLTQGDEKKPEPKTDKTAQAAPAGKGDAAAMPAAAKKEDAKPEALKPADKPADKPATPAAQKPAEPEKVATNQPSETPKNTTANTPRWEPETPKDVPSGPTTTEYKTVVDKDGKEKKIRVNVRPTPPFDCKSLKPLEFLPTTPKEKVDEWKALAADAIVDGARGRRAQASLEKAGREALPAIINALRELDYSNTDQVIVGFQLNKLLERMTKGVNQMYRTLPPDETPKQDDIYYNNTTVKVWQEFFTTFANTEENWQKVLTRNDWQDKKLEEIGK